MKIPVCLRSVARLNRTSFTSGLWSVAMATSSSTIGLAAELREPGFGTGDFERCRPNLGVTILHDQPLTGKGTGRISKVRTPRSTSNTNALYPRSPTACAPPLALHPPPPPRYTPLEPQVQANGPAGLQERSRAPHRCPHRIDAGMATAIVEVRRQHPSWGLRNLLAWLEERRPEENWPAASTVGDLLKGAKPT